MTGPKAPIVSPGGYIPLGSDGKAERQEVKTEMAQLIAVVETEEWIFWEFKNP